MTLATTPKIDPTDYTKHHDVFDVHRSNYESDRLPEEARQWLKAQLGEATRTSFYKLTEEQREWASEWSAENTLEGKARLTYEFARDRLGLMLVSASRELIVDDEGEPILDDDGKEQFIVGKLPDFDLKIDVVQEGLTDVCGNPIPKGMQYFVRLFQTANRPLNESNYGALIDRMLAGWVFNGESFLKDANGMGASEQHRCTARVILTLGGYGKKGKKNTKPPEWGPLVTFTDGVHPLCSITIDTGKSNTGGDIFASDPSIMPPELLKSKKAFTAIYNTGEVPEDIPIYVGNRAETRVSAINKMQGGVKRLLLRMSGKNVTGSIKGGGQHATEVAHRICTTIMPDADHLAALVSAFSCPRIEINSGGSVRKVQPITDGDLFTALAIHAVSQEEPIDVFDEGKEGMPDSSEAAPMRWNVDDYIPFLQDLADSEGTNSTPLTGWLHRRATTAVQADRGDKFAQLLRLVEAYHDDEFSPDPESGYADLAPKANWKPKTGYLYYHLGGADIGAKVKAKKGE